MTQSDCKLKKYKLLRTLRNSTNEEPGNKIKQTMEKRITLK